MDAQVIGEIVGEVLGEVLGDVDGDGDVSGLVRRGGGRGRNLLRLPKKPGWRQGRITPGVVGPLEGLQMLPLQPDVGGGVFTALITRINYVARPQHPFRGRRLLAAVARSGVSAAPLFAMTAGTFIGTQLQQAQIGNWNVEFFAPTAFGVELQMTPSEAGIDVTFPLFLSGALAGADTIGVQLLLLGDYIG